ncbi:hypothetical protein WDU94_008690 [Cyamophila willieti]
MDGQKKKLGENENENGCKVQYGFRSACSQVTASVAQNFLLFSLGMSFGMPTVVVGVLDHKVATNETIFETPDLILSDEESSWLGSILFLFHPFGAVISGYMLEYVGRKRLMIAVGIPFFIGWISLYLAQSVSIIMVGTICMGLGVGCCEAPIISYIGEISEPRMRGSLSLFAGAACNFGILIIFLYLCFDGLEGHHVDQLHIPHPDHDNDSVYSGVTDLAGFQRKTGGGRTVPEANVLSTKYSVIERAMCDLRSYGAGTKQTKGPRTPPRR